MLDQLSALVKNGAVPKDDACVKSILDFFVAHGFFVVKKKEKAGKSGVAAVRPRRLGLQTAHPGAPQLRHAPEPPFSADLQKECRTRLLAALAELLTFTPSKKENGKTN